MEHLPFVQAIVFYGNIFYSPVWSVVHPDRKTARLYDGYPGWEYVFRHQIESGLSFGVFDLEYKFKREESKPDGKLYWDFKDTSLNRDQLQEQMDFPLVSVAMAYDGFNPMDKGQLTQLNESFPLFPTVTGTLGARDTRPEASWKPTAKRQVLLRGGTCTRHDAEGKGIMKALAQFLMRYAHEQGFRAIQINCSADAVTHVWSEPPPPFKGTVVCEFNTGELEEEVEVDGVKKKVKPFGDKCQQRVTKVYCDLKPSEADAHVKAAAAVPAIGALA